MQASETSALLAIDQHRATVVDRILCEWGNELTGIDAAVDRASLQEMLFAMRADHLLAATLRCCEGLNIDATRERGAVTCINELNETL